MKFLLWLAYMIVCIGSVAVHDIGTADAALILVVIAFTLGFFAGLSK